MQGWQFVWHTQQSADAEAKGPFTLAGGAGEESTVLDNGGDVQNAGFCPSAESRRTTDGWRRRCLFFILLFFWGSCHLKHLLKDSELRFNSICCKFHHRKTTKPKIISELYSSLQNLNIDHTFKMKERWEAEGGLPVSQEEWNRTCR